MDINENDYTHNEYMENGTGEESTDAGPQSEPEHGQETQPQQEQPASQYNNAGVGRKESPFANSPYVMNRESHENTSGNVQPETKAPKQKKCCKGWRAAVAVILTVVLVGGSCGITAAAVNHHWENRTAAMEQTLNQKIADLQKRVNSGSQGSSGAVSGSQVSSQESMTPGQVYAQNVNSVVAISNQGITTNIYGQVSETASSGSGFILSDDGYVVSNYHVVEDATKLTVMTFDGTEYPAQLVGYDQANDVALLKIDATGLDPVTIGSSDALTVGDQVAAIGNPLGELTSTLTVGYISAKDRTINTDGIDINMMHTDAAINSGNSGGQLFNMKGEVVGIATAKYSGSSISGASIEGIGFAIPIDDVVDMLGDLRDYGYVTGAYLGVSVISLDASTAELYSLPTGSLVKSVEEGSCAQKAGIQVQDIIVGIGSYGVSSNSELTRALRKFDAGETTTITVFRAGQKIDMTITLDEKPAPVEDTTTEQTVPDNQTSQEGGYGGWFPFFGGR